jgi:hypothetical protein
MAGTSDEVFLRAFRWFKAAVKSPLVASGVPDVPLAGAAPIEALVEREQVLAIHPKLNAQAGQQLMRQLRASGLKDAVTNCSRISPQRSRHRRILSGTMPGSSGTRC